VPRKRREVVPASLGESVDARRSEESVAALAAQERAEYALRASEARYRQALVEAQAALNRSEALYKVTRSLVAAETVVAVLQRVADAVADAFRTDRVNLFALDMDRRLVTGNYRGGPGSEREFFAEFDELMDGLVGWVLRERKVTISPGGVRDPREPQRIHDHRAEFGHGPMMVAPILYRDRTLGVVTVTNLPGERQFEQADADLLSAMATEAAVCVETATLGELLEAARSQLEARVAQRTAALAESEDRYRRITETITDYLFHVELSGDVVTSRRHGPGCIAVTGYSPNDFEADPMLWLDIVRVDDRELVLQHARDVAANRKTHAIEHRIVRRDGAERWVRSTPVPQYGHDGSLVAYDELIQDITERRALQEEVVQAQKMEGIGRLAGGVAHDFNNLLTAILGNAELALLDLDPDHPARANIDEVTKAAEGAARLTRQLLSFARRQVIEPIPLNLNEVIGSSLEMLARLLGEDIEITTALHDPLGVVEADPGQIQQLLVNLAVNARDAMPNGGRLAIETSNETVTDEYSASQPSIAAGRYVTLAVTDTGTGMSEKVLEHLFEPFFTTKPQGKGTGLGLATCHGIVTQSGGNIWVHSEVGQGTTVTINLPRRAPSADRAGEPAAPERSGPGTETVLVVEDEASVRRLAVLGLRSKGYVVLEASNAAEALRIAATEHQIALVISDVIMPGMRGPELASRLHELRPDARVILTSGHTDVPEAFRDDDGQLIPFLQKPFTPDGLAHKVRAVLDGSGDARVIGRRRPARDGQPERGPLSGS
jgi:two-component system cell cycle sensor histidine kinase/response regulator CckA